MPDRQALWQRRLVAAQVVYAAAKWRDSTGRQSFRRLGRAWMEPDGAGGWRKRRGRAPEGFVDRRDAERMMDALIDEVERELVEIQPDREATFADAVRAWREWAEHTKRLKPATLRNYDALLAPPGERPRRGGQRLARIMRAFGTRRIAEVTPAEVERFLRRLDREGLPGRSVNSHRQALANVLEYAARPDGFALRRRFRLARDAAGLPPLPFDHLRHTFATLAIRGLDPLDGPDADGPLEDHHHRALPARAAARELAERMDAIFAVTPPMAEPSAERTE